MILRNFHHVREVLSDTPNHVSDIQELSWIRKKINVQMLTLSQQLTKNTILNDRKQTERIK
jgi:hypothetical protein